jgi:hypothetical protein
VAAFLLLVAGALALFGTREVALRKTGITAALMLAGWLMPRHIRWCCVSCGATYRRQPPPRGENVQGQPTEANDENTGRLC